MPGAESTGQRGVSVYAGAVSGAFARWLHHQYPSRRTAAGVQAYRFGARRLVAHDVVSLLRRCCRRPTKPTSTSQLGVRRGMRSDNKTKRPTACCRAPSGPDAAVQLCVICNFPHLTQSSLSSTQCRRRCCCCCVVVVVVAAPRPTSPLPANKQASNSSYGQIACGGTTRR